jgi:hypothetical protein
MAMVKGVSGIRQALMMHSCYNAKPSVRVATSVTSGARPFGVELKHTPSKTNMHR